MPERVVKVLDLFCGAGRIRLPLLKRFPTAKLHYTGIDTYAEDRFEKASNEIPTSQRRRIKQKLVSATLDMTRPKRLAHQLRGILGKEKFDEIHFHSPKESTRFVPVEGTESLRVLATFMKPGGRFYHLFAASPIYGDRWLSITPPERVSAVFRRNRILARAIAESAGLQLDKYGLRMPRTRTGWDPSFWITSPEALSARIEKVASAYSKTLHQYTAYDDCRHFVILRKPK